MLASSLLIDRYLLADLERAAFLSRGLGVSPPIKAEAAASERGTN